MQDKIKLIGIDLAKDIFWVRAENCFGKTVIDQKVARAKLFEFVVQLKPELIAMEACGGAHYWARRFKESGINCLLIAPQYVRPYRISDKNDRNDTRAILEASKRPDLKSVQIKSIFHQDMALLVNERATYVAHRTEMLNRLRSVLSEYGFIFGKSRQKLIVGVKTLLEKEEKLTSPLKAKVIRDLNYIKQLDDEIKLFNQELKKVIHEDPVCKTLFEQRGVGPVTAVALRAHVVNPHDYKNGRCLSASLGLTPRQIGSGGKVRLVGINKNGNRYIRQLLIHGARTMLTTAHLHEDPVSQWAIKKREEIGFNKACVALANKNARMLWALMAKSAHTKQAA